MSSYETTQIAEIMRPDGWAPIRRLFDVRGFGVNAWTGSEVGSVVIPDHDETPTGHEELYLVLEGHASFSVEGDEIEAPAGTVVFVREPAAKRGAHARVAATTVLSIGARPGEAYEPRSWEVNRDVYPLLDAGEHAEAKQLLLNALVRYDDRSELLFNLACAEAQLGELEEAIGHLEEAVAERASLAKDAAEDAELEPLRGDPRFAAITGR